MPHELLDGSRTRGQSGEAPVTQSLITVTTTEITSKLESSEQPQQEAEEEKH